MKKILAVVMITLALVGCKAESTNTTETFKLPDELSQCHMYYLTSTDGVGIHALVCPNSTTSTRWKEGKTDREFVSRMD